MSKQIYLEHFCFQLENEVWIFVQSKMGNKLKHEKLFGSNQEKYKAEIEHLSNLSSSFFRKTKQFSNLNILFESSKSMRTLTEDGQTNLLLKYDIQTNSLKIIRLLPSITLSCFVSTENENEIFVYEKKISDSIFCFKCNTEEETEDIEARFAHDKELFSQFSSIKYFDSKMEKILEFKLVDSIIQLNIVKENLFICSKNSCLVMDVEKKEILQTIDLYGWKFNSFLKMTENYIYCKDIGFTMKFDEDYKSYRPEFDQFHSISKNEEYMLYFDESKSIGNVHQMSSVRFPSTYRVDSNISFALFGSVISICFSEDSEFIFILTQDENKLKLIVFSIRENKFVCVKKMEDLKDVAYMDCMNNLILFSDFSRMLQQVLEVRIPQKLKPYPIVSPTDIEFKFQ
jgi:hypothetical protein